MATNKIEEAKKLTALGQYAEAYAIIAENLTEAFYMEKDYFDMYEMYRRAAEKIEKALYICDDQVNYKGFYNNELECIGFAEINSLSKTLEHLQKQAELYKNMYYVACELIDVYNKAIGE